MKTWFAVENSLIDRNDLTAYEKLCGMVLARYAGRSEFDHLLTTDIIAVKMGVDSNTALTALRGLVSKGLIDVESTSDLFVEGSPNNIRELELAELEESDTHILRAQSAESDIQSFEYENLDPHTPNSDIILDSLVDPSQTLMKDQSDKSSSYKDSKVDDEPIEPELDNLDRMLMESKLAEKSHGKEHAAGDVVKRGEVEDAKRMEVLKEVEQLDPELIKKSIHEQSDSVRAWIEESETATGTSAASTVQNPATLNREALVENVMEMIDEPINDRQARIILGLAEYDLEKVKKCYTVAQNAQVTDKIDMLIHELQKKDEAPAPARTPRASQVDHMRLHQMKKYQAMKKK